MEFCLFCLLLSRLAPLQLLEVLASPCEQWEPGPSGPGLGTAVASREKTPPHTHHASTLVASFSQVWEGAPHKETASVRLGAPHAAGSARPRTSHLWCRSLVTSHFLSFLCDSPTPQFIIFHTLSVSPANKEPFLLAERPEFTAAFSSGAWHFPSVP